MKNLDYYMSLPYEVEVTQINDEEDGGYQTLLGLIPLPLGMDFS